MQEEQQLLDFNCTLTGMGHLPDRLRCIAEYPMICESGWHKCSFLQTKKSIVIYDWTAVFLALDF